MYSFADSDLLKKIGGGLYLPEQHHNIVEIYPAIAVEIKRTDRLVCHDPLHLVEHEYNVV
jgi:hypothetical protein